MPFDLTQDLQDANSTLMAFNEADNALTLFDQNRQRLVDDRSQKEGAYGAARQKLLDDINVTFPPTNSPGPQFHTGLGDEVMSVQSFQPQSFESRQKLHIPNPDQIKALWAKYHDKWVDPSAALRDLLSLASNPGWPMIMAFLTAHGRELLTDTIVGFQFMRDLFALFA